MLIRDKITTANRILIIPDKRIDLDLMASSISLAKTLSANSKQVSILINELNYPNFISRLISPDSLNFLETKKPKNFIITLKNQKNVKVKSVRWEQKDDNINIVITTEEGDINKNDTQIRGMNPNFDLILLVGFTTPSKIGNFFDDNPSLFTKERVEFINLTSEDKESSLAEICYQIISDLKLNIKGEILTDLLAGLYWKTNGFRDTNSTEYALENAKRMIADGANMRSAARKSQKNLKIIEAKLISEILTNLRITKEKIAISTVRKERLSNLKMLDIVYKNWNLAKFIEDIKASLVLIETSHRVFGFVNSSTKDINAGRVAARLGGAGNMYAAQFASSKSISELESEILPYLGILPSHTFKEPEAPKPAEKQKFTPKRADNNLDKPQKLSTKERIMKASQKVDKTKVEREDIPPGEKSQPAPKPVQERPRVEDSTPKLKSENVFSDEIVVPSTPSLENNPEQSNFDPLMPATSIPEPIDLTGGTIHKEKPKINTPLPPAAG